MTKTVTIQGVMIDLEPPYTEGHTVNEAEAKALNTQWAENIANNNRAAIKKMLETDGATAESVQKEAQKMVSKYAGEYEFTLASAGGRARLDPLEKECIALAKELVAGALKEQGLTQKAYREKNGDEALATKVAEVAEMPQVIEAAKQRLAERAKLADFSV